MAISLVFTEPCASSPVGTRTIIQSSSSATPAKPIIDVSVVYPRFEDLARHASVSGKFEASERATVKAEFRGFLERVFVAEGDSVNAGDSLFTYRGDELAAEVAKKQAEIREAEATLELDQQSLAQLNLPPPPSAPPANPSAFPDDAPPPVDRPIPDKFQEPAVAAQAVLPPKNTADLSAKIRVDEARIELLTRELEQLEMRRTKLNVTSPIAGIIQKRTAAEGSVVEAGDSLFEIVTLNPAVLSVFIPQNLSSFVDQQTAVKVTPLDTPQIEIDGTVRFVSPAIEAATQTLEVRVQVPNANLAIKEGTSGKALIYTKRVDKVLILPARAVVNDSGKNYIYVAMGNEAQKVEVQRGETLNNDELEVIANIRVDDPVVLGGSSQLTDKTPIRVIKEVPNQAPPPLTPPPVLTSPAPPPEPAPAPSAAKTP